MKKRKESNRKTPRPWGYWKDFENLKRELTYIIEHEYQDEKGRVIKATGEFPTKSQLLRLHLSALSNATVRYYGGLTTVRRRMGYQRDTKPLGYWKDFEKLKTGLTDVIQHEYRDEKENLIKKKGEFPTNTQLARMGHGRLSSAIRKKHGGFNAVREKLGYQLSTKQRGYWKDFENLKRELTHIIQHEYQDKEENLIKRKGEFPTQQQLVKIGRNDLCHAVGNHHGGLIAVRGKLGYELNVKPTGYWKDFGNVKRELAKVIDNEYFDKNGTLIKRKGEFPTGHKLRRIGRSDLDGATTIHHGGLNAIRKKLGYELTAKPPDYWMDFENVKKELDQIIRSEYLGDRGQLIKAGGSFPSQEQLFSIGKSSLVAAINRHHGSFRAVREMFGYPLTAKPPNYWKDFGRVLKKLTEVIEGEYFDKNGQLVKMKGKFPTVQELQKIGRTDLSNAIALHHGGVNAVKQKLGYDIPRKPSGYWSDFENVKKDLRNVIQNEYFDAKGTLIKEKGEFPTQQQLQSMQRTDLSNAISHHHGGWDAVRQKLGYDIPRKPRGYWSDFDNVKRELLGVIKEEYFDDKGKLIKAKGHYPNSKQLRMIGQSSLVVAIVKYHGGLNTIRRKLGFEMSHKSPGYWLDPENIEKELWQVIETEYFDGKGNLIKRKGEFPTTKVFAQIGRHDLQNAINLRLNGSNALRSKFGFKLLKQPNGYWQDFGNVRKELESLIEKIGAFPRSSDLKRAELWSLAGNISKYHGGLAAVKERMDYGTGVPREKIREFVRKAETIEGAREILGCPDLTMADKADILIVRSKETFRSIEYIEWVASEMFNITSLKPYLRRDNALRRHFDPYNFGRHDLDDVVDRYPHFLETPRTYELVLRKLENIYFKRMRQDKPRALAELRHKKKHERILGQLYDQVHKNCKEIFALRIPGTVTRIKNPYKVKERKLLEDGTVEWIHSGKESEYVEFPALHQKRGILHIARHKRILIADEMGTGKTAQAVLAKLYLEHKSGQRLKTLIICPNSIKELWIEKIDEYCKNISRKEIVVLAGHRDKETALKHAKEDVDFVITNYALLSRSPDVGQFNLVDELTKMAFDYVIVDEVHNAKNMDANRAISVSKITKDVEYLVLLSGTPIPNRLKDMGMTMHILDPQRFPNPIAFNRLYSKNPRILRDLLLSGRMLRVRANEVIQLPALKSRKITVNPTAPQREAYIRVFLDKKLNSYSKLAKLRRILIDPNIIPAYLDVSRAQSGKLKKLDGIIHEKATQGEKTVVYTNFKYRVTDMLARRYAKYGVCVIDGDVPARTRMNDDSDREKIRKEFQTGDKRVLIATIGTLCEGVDLTAARTVIFLDPPFTSTAMDQSTSRVHRLGQSRPVEVYNLIASDRTIADITRHPETGQSGTIDEAMYDLVEKKERIIDHVIDGARLSKDELKLLEKNSDASQLLKSIAYAISPSS